MTNEEAIRWINNYLESRKDDRGDTEIDIALKMAIKALEQTDCEKCEYLVYDEVFDEETGEEYDASYCRKQEPCEDCISRAEVMRKVKNHLCYNDFSFEKYYDTKLKADLESLPSVQPKPIECEDCISRAEAIKALEYDLSIEADGGLDKYRTVIKDLLNAIYNTQKKAIENLPSVQPKAKVGHWVVHPKGVYAHLVCDRCLSIAPRDCEVYFCPNCGAKMLSTDSESEDT